MQESKNSWFIFLFYIKLCCIQSDRCVITLHGVDLVNLLDRFYGKIFMELFPLCCSYLLLTMKLISSLIYVIHCSCYPITLTIDQIM